MAERLTELESRVLKRVRAGYVLGDKLQFTALSLEMRGFLRFEARPFPRYVTTESGRAALRRADGGESEAQQ